MGDQEVFSVVRERRSTSWESWLATCFVINFSVRVGCSPHVLSQNCNVWLARINKERPDVDGGVRAGGHVLDGSVHEQVIMIDFESDETRGFMEPSEMHTVVGRPIVGAWLVGDCARGLQLRATLTGA